MKNLKDLLFGVSIDAVIGNTNREVSVIQFDSRKINVQDLFVAIKGTQADGHDYLTQVAEKGAAAIICETLPEVTLESVTYIQTKNTHKALAIIASNYFDQPSQKLSLVGITGTNGKTTTASLLYQLFQNSGMPSGLISTVKICLGDQAYGATHTTPDAITINSLLNQLVQLGITQCFMEVSSHGIDQERTAGLHFAGAVFTNLTHDHLDYHGDFATYRDIKKRLFDQLTKEAFALVNADDKNGLYMIQNTRAKKLTYALKTSADFKGKIIENQLSGLLLRINDSEVWSHLIGSFNAYNLLAIYCTAVLLKMDSLETLKGISGLQSVTGRFQYFISEDNITAIVDYAHTPDALKNVLETINAIRTKNEALITVFGCGGDRDRTKRPKMAHIATSLSDKVILTNDNPRTEVPESIIEEMEAGVSPVHFKKTICVLDRKQAIKTAVQLAQPGDIILIAGKGHETYQEINGKRFDFNDFETVHHFINQAAS